MEQLDLMARMHRLKHNVEQTEKASHCSVYTTIRGSPPPRRKLLLNVLAVLHERNEVLECAVGARAQLGELVAVDLLNLRGASERAGSKGQQMPF